MHRIGVVALLVLTGCLKIPPPAPNPCGEVGDFRTKVLGLFPGTVGLRDTIVADLNADGADDLILVSSEADDDGFFVLLGPQDHPAGFFYAARIDTNVKPYGLVAADLLGNDGCLDIAVFGPDSGATAGTVEIYQNVGDLDNMFAPVPVTKNVGFVPDGAGPVSIVSGDFDGDGNALDLAISDLTRLRLLELGSDVTRNIATALVQTVDKDGQSGDWDDINALFTSGAIAASRGDDLIVVEQQEISWLRNDGNGGFAPALTGLADGRFNINAVEAVDIDGVPPLDYVGGSGDSFGAYLVARSGQTVEFDVREWPPSLPVYDQLNDLTAGELGGPGGQPEVVIAERDEQGSEPGLALVVDSLAPDGSDGLMPTDWSGLGLGGEGLDPTISVILDFNGDGYNEAWFFDEVGRAVCTQRPPGRTQPELCELQPGNN